MNTQKFVVTLYDKIESCGEGCCSWNASYIEIIDDTNGRYIRDINASNTSIHSIADLIEFIKDKDPDTGSISPIRILDHQVEYRIEHVFEED